MTRREFFRRLKSARDQVSAEIKMNGASGNKYARGLAAEGYAGGYRDALDDVQAMLSHGYARDSRGYWVQSTQEVK